MADYTVINGEKFYPTRAGGLAPQGVPGYLRKAGGPYGRGGFRFTWRGGYLRTAVTEGIDQAMKEQQKRILSRLRRELHKYPKHRRHQLAPRAFCRVDVVGNERVARRLVAGSNASFAVYHELGTSKFVGHPQIRQIMDQERLQLAPAIRARATQLMRAAG